MEDERVPPLSRRVPGAYGHAPPLRSPLVLTDAEIAFLRSALENEREQAAAQSQDAAHGNGGESTGPVPVEAESPAAADAVQAAEPWYRSNAESVTQPLVIISGPEVSGLIASVAESTTAAGRSGQAGGPGLAGSRDGTAGPDSPDSPDGPDRGGGLADIIQAARKSLAAEQIAGQAAAGAGRHPARRRRQLTVLVAAVVLVAAGAVAAALLSGPAGHPASRPVSRHHPAGTVAAAIAREQAASWVASQVSSTARVACDPVMCAALVTHGIPSSDLTVLRLPLVSLRRSAVIVATAAVRSLLGARLSKVFAPVVLASFGTGPHVIDIRVVARHGAAAYRARLRADLAARRHFGAALLHSGQVLASRAARRQLSAGQVDARLQITIEDVAAGLPLYLVGFGDASPGASAGVPLRSAYLIQPPGSGQLSPAFVRSVLSYLRGPDAPYPRVQAGTLTLADGQTVLQIEFGAPSPLGLLGSAGP